MDGSHDRGRPRSSGLLLMTVIFGCALNTLATAEAAEEIRRLAPVLQASSISHAPARDVWHWSVSQCSFQPGEGIPAPLPPDSQNSPRENENFGEPPPDTSRQFLRQNTVLLDPGQCQIDFGVVYQLNDLLAPVVDQGQLVNLRIRRRQIFAPLTLRYGWSPRLQLFGVLPVGWSHVELATPFSDRNANTGGLGDLRLGFTHLLRQGNYCRPDVVFTFQSTIPTSDGPTPLTADTTGFGDDVWGLSAQLQMIHTYDPMTVFWGFGYRYLFEKETNQGDTIQLGQQISYQLGTGFAVNDRISLVAALIGFFVTETEFNGLGLPATQSEPIRARFALTAYRFGKIVEPFMEIGMTREAPDARLGVIWTY